MIRFLLKIGIFLVVGILIYNYFWGDNSEKAQSKAVFGEMRDVVVSVSGLLKTEKQKYNAGKYDSTNWATPMWSCANKLPNSTKQ
jgi:hypothetical protein